ncbi:MAG: hypothetical protein P8N43_05890 [Alphaproteobacteria bacterium]|nr:hypothetical protein [Alphaproteobacteria bacterium]
MLNSKFVGKNHLKKWSLALRETKEAHGVGTAEVELVLFAYDYEFFTITHIAKAMKRNRAKLYERTILPLKRKGLVEDVHYAKDVDSFVNAMFEGNDWRRNESRLGLSRRGRLLVQSIYRRLE